jgi:hypothetical protein
MSQSPAKQNRLLFLVRLFTKNIKNNKCSFLSFCRRFIFCSAMFLIVMSANAVEESILEKKEGYKQNLQSLYSESQNTAKLGNNVGTNSDRAHKLLLEVGEPSSMATELGNLPMLGLVAKEGEESKSSQAREGASEEQLLPKCTKAGCDISNIMSARSINERESKLESLGFKKDLEHFPDQNKGYIDTANHKAAEYRSKFDVISSEYKDCKSTLEDSSTESVTCDQYYDIKYKMCPINQVVEIDPKYTYECSKKRNETIKTCHDEVVSIKCQKDGECDNNGIILDSVKTNLKEQSYKYPTLYVGTPFWKPNICSIDSSKYTTFTVKNLEKVQSVILERILFDDYVMVKINDKLVYHGPDSEPGEDRIELVVPGRWGVITTNGKNKKSCERSTNWDRRPNIDLKPFLKEGDNTISITIATAGHGNAQLWIKTTQHCCKAWEVIRETKCEYEGEKSL